MTTHRKPSTYEAAGVSQTDAARALSYLAGSVAATHGFRDGRGVGRPIRGLGYYANVLDLGGGQGLAVSCDGVGTKLLVAEALDRYDTVGIDCIAMNVNDLVCVGAEPIAMLDYVAVGRADAQVLDQLGRGLLEGARACHITIPGGELAQVREMLRGDGRSEGFDVVGTAIGLVPTDRILWGQDVVPGDIVVGIASRGLHSNGFSLARKVLAPTKGDLKRWENDLGRTVGDELLEPTALYVDLALELLRSELPLHALCHITGDGFMNLTRVEAPVGFVLDDFPETPAVFRLIEERGGVTKSEMFSVFNMGIGFCVMLPESHARAVLDASSRHGFDARVLGRVIDERGVVRIPEHRLVSHQGTLTPES